MNEVLMTMWLWSLEVCYGREALWKKVIVSKPGTDSFGWWSKGNPHAHRVGFW